jgi:hypothetical protein
MARYHAFISYSQGKDKTTAAAVQPVIQKLGKPLVAGVSEAIRTAR